MIRMKTNNRKINGYPSKAQLRIIEFLKGHYTGVLATVSRHHKPNATAIYYYVDDSGEISFLTKRLTRKVEDLQMNNCVMLVVYDESEQTVVQIDGIASEITDEKEAHQAFRNTLRASLHTAESAVPPVTKLDAGDYVAFKIDPTEMHIAVYDHHSRGEHESLLRDNELPVLNLGT